MAVINTQYSTLEEAWGTDVKTSKMKRECDLYEKSKKGILRRPYRQNTEKDMVHKNMMLLNDEGMDNEDYERYHGYSDSRKYSRTSKPLKKHKERSSSKKQKSKKHVIIDPSQNSYYEPEEDFMQSRALRPRKLAGVEDEYIYEEAFDEDEDNYLTQQGGLEERDRDFIRRNIEEEDEEDDYVVDEDEINEEVVEEEQRDSFIPRSRKSGSRKVVKRSHAVDNRQLLDLTIYTMSGIILIFMMEQFIQIGVNMSKK
tara:strand:+ start:1389 stop:2156 length:768 start_codon:yes stop_codon:yes gene_type:complete